MADNFSTLLEQDGFIDNVQKACRCVGYRITGTFEPKDTVVFEILKNKKVLYVHIVMATDGSDYGCCAMSKNKDDYSFNSHCTTYGKSLKQAFCESFYHMTGATIKD